MALAETANLMVKLSLGGNFTSQIGKATKGLGQLEKGSSRAYKAGAQIGTGIRNAGKLAAVGVGVLVSQVAFGLDSLVKLESQTAQTEAVIKSTGGVAGVTAKDVRKLAESYEALNATIGDETIQNAQNLLLTFTKISKDAFEPALAAALDMNQALGGGPEGLAGNAKLLGKALQDPEKGLSRLGRSVGGFSDATIKAVKEAVKNNDTLKAQNIILAELEKRYGGSFARAGNTTAGSVAKFGDAIEDLQRSLATALLPTVRNVADALTEFLADPEVVKGAEDLGKTLAGVLSKDNIKSGIAALGSVISTIRGAMPAIASAASVIGGVVKTSVDLFNTLPTELKTLLVAGVGINKLTGGLVTNLAGGLISAVLSSFKGLMTVNAGIVQVNGAAGAMPVSPAAGWSTLFALIGPAVAAAIGVEAATQAANADLQSKGIPQKFQTPGSGVLPFGIDSSINNLLSAVKILQNQKTPEAIREASRVDSRATLQVEQTTRRGLSNMSAALERQKAATQEATRATAIGAALGAAVTRFSAAANASQISATIRANRPIITTVVNVTANSYTKTVEVSRRYGSPNASRDQGDTGGGAGGQ